MNCTWGDFQSLIQFATAANLVVFTFVQLRDYYSLSEVNLLHLTKEDIDAIEEGELKKKLRRRYHAIKRKFENTLRDDELVFTVLNPASVILFFGSFLMLLVSSFIANELISPGWVFAVLLTNLPPLVAGVFILLRMVSYSDLRKERRKLEGHL